MEAHFLSFHANLRINVTNKKVPRVHLKISFAVIVCWLRARWASSTRLHGFSGAEDIKMVFCLCKRCPGATARIDRTFRFCFDTHMVKVEEPRYHRPERLSVSTTCEQRN